MWKNECHYDVGGRDLSFTHCIVSRHDSSIQNLHFSDSRVKHYLASYRFVATGKQETIKEEKVAKHEDIAM